HYVVREQSVRYLEPIHGSGAVVVTMWLTALGSTSATYGFEISSHDGTQVHARAERIHVKLDPVTLRPVPWTARLREQLAALLRPVA
ncbi:MAG: acyl-CoA thioesterase, partial [Acidimicrobiales bacterium]